MNEDRKKIIFSIAFFVAALIVGGVMGSLIGGFVSKILPAKAGHEAALTTLLMLVGGGLGAIVLGATSLLIPAAISAEPMRTRQPSTNNQTHENNHQQHQQQQQQQQQQKHTHTPKETSTSNIEKLIDKEIIVKNPQDVLNSLFCPITREVMKNPVTAEDGYNYEETAILQYLNQDKYVNLSLVPSPMTKENMGKKLIHNHPLKSMIDLLNNNSQLLLENKIEENKDDKNKNENKPERLKETIINIKDQLTSPKTDSIFNDKNKNENEKKLDIIIEKNDNQPTEKTSLLQKK